MKKKLLLFIIRLIRFFKAEDTYIPNLRAVPDGKVQTGKIYRYYGRILVSRKWDHTIHFVYEELKDGTWQPCSPLRYDIVLKEKGDAHVRAIRSGDACSRCYCHQQGLPCRCDFVSGTNTGYYELVHADTQYSDNIQL